MEQISHKLPTLEPLQLLHDRRVEYENKILISASVCQAEYLPAVRRYYGRGTKGLQTWGRQLVTSVPRSRPGAHPQEAQPRTGTTELASTINMRSAFRTMGVLRPEGQTPAEPVALEMAVVATGARPGDVAAKRELFAEETQTVLVFERGAVLRLSAAVADGQLLFLTNKKTGKEVVAQVVRKRSFRPTSCYVDLEFTEAIPGFWGIEFPRSAPALPSQIPSDSGEDRAGESATHVEPPDQQEIERLKKEVAELQTRLNTLSESAISLPKASGAGGGHPTSERARQQHDEEMLAHLLAQEEQQEQLHGPKRLMAYPKKPTSSTIKTVSRVATAGASAAVIIAALIAAYRFELLDSFISKSAKPAPVHTVANLNSAVPSMPKSIVASTANPAPAPSQALPDTSSSAPQSKATAGISPLPNVIENPILANGIPAPRATNTTPKDSERRSPSRSNSSLGVSESASSSTTVPESAPTAEDYVAPKLVHSVKSVAPPEALRNYVTGSVKVDALVDTTGQVKSVTVLSGPQKLYNTAIQEMKQYVYQPARNNGKPVVSHVQVILQYWYEP